MSHTTTIDGIIFTDIAALRAAIEELNQQGISCSLTKDSTPRAYYPNQTGMGKAPYVVRLNRAPYDVGLYWNEEKKGYEPRTDLFGGSVAGQLGVPMQAGGNPLRAALGKLNRVYAAHAATRQASKQGYSVRRINKDDGSIRLVVTGV